MASVNCHSLLVLAVLVARLLQVTGGSRLAVAWITLVPAPPAKYSVTLPSGLRTMLVITAGGRGIGTLNTVPTPPGPPLNVVPYNALPSGNSPATGNAPSLLVPVLASIALNACSVWNCVPLVLTEKIVPLALAPPAEAVPNRLPPNNASGAQGEAPS